MRFMSIASGSSGNCIYVGSDRTNILTDVGISKKRIIEGLNRAELDGSDVDAILITHEHIDHVKSLGVISRAFNIPIYATESTCMQLMYMKKQLGEFDYELLNNIDADRKFMIGDIEVTPHAIWHDAVDPVCYSFENGGRKISIATDLGDYDDYLVNGLKDSDAMLIESNHDERMLMAGPYPYDLKQRILGKRGHLSNENSGKLIRALLNDHMKCIMLGHLSEKNNYPELAYVTVKNELQGNEFSDDVEDFMLHVARRDVPGSVFDI